MDQSPNPDTREVLLTMYKEANQMLTDKVKSLSIENSNLKKQIATMNVAPIDTEPAFKASANSSLSPTTNGDSRVQLLEKELNGKDDEILKLRAEADMSAHSSRSRSAAKRRLSDLTDRERRLYRRVSDECTKLVTEKVDVEQSQSAQLKTKFQEACADMEESNREIMEKFKTDFLELKEKLFTTIHSPQNIDS